MEKINFVKNGVLRLPPGFRFHPTDEELVVQYLKRKILSYPLPAPIIQEVDVNKSDPWDLPGDSEQERYFFSTREVKYPNGNRSNRATGSGYWKATGIDRQIVSSRSHQAVGMKKTLVFYTGKHPTGCRTDWIMHEYRLAQAQITTPQGRTLSQENWVVCRIFLKRRSDKNDEQVAQVQKEIRGAPIVGNSVPVFYDLNLVPVSSSSGSSGITEIESDHEESSICNSFTRKPRQQ